VNEIGESGCAKGRAVREARSVAISPDGRRVFVAGGVALDGGLAEFARLSASGRLTQIGCFHRLRRDCARGRGLETPSSPAISPDGRNVYVAATNGNTIGVYRRSQRGALAPLPGLKACVTSDRGVATCARAQGLIGVESVAVSPDGRHVYAAASGLVLFARSASDGALTQLSGAAGYLRGVVARVLEISGDGRTVYLAEGGGTHGRLRMLARDPATGALTLLTGAGTCFTQGPAVTGCEAGIALAQPAAILATRDGRNVYVASETSSGVASFRRDPTTGALRQLAAPDGCVTTTGSTGRCRKGDALVLATDLALSPNGRRLYVASSDRKRGGLAVFERRPETGVLRQLGCVTSVKLGRCGRGRALVGASGVAVSPDGKNLYVAGRGRGSGVAVFAIG
jgi:6-phosphogluconolactonase (cycloisomerase 2 family)